MAQYKLLRTETADCRLHRQGYKVLILDKDLVFYKVNETEKTVIIYAVADQRQDHLDIIRGL